MKLRVIISILTFIALASTVLAQGEYSEGGEVDQVITVNIPSRLALHVTETSYNLDLDDPTTAGDPNNGFYPYDGTWASSWWPEGEGCYLLPKHVELNPAYESFIGLTNAVLANGIANASYPAVVLDNGDVAQVGGNYLKGSLVCFNQKVIQKFANVPWMLTADVEFSATGSMGTFGIVDVIMDRYYIPVGQPGHYTGGIDGVSEGAHRYLLNSSATGLVLSEHPSATTGGWLDDRVTEVFWFDGSETPGNHEITVTYTLTDFVGHSH